MTIAIRIKSPARLGAGTIVSTGITSISSIDKRIDITMELRLIEADGGYLT